MLIVYFSFVVSRVFSGQQRRDNSRLLIRILLIERKNESNFEISVIAVERVRFFNIHTITLKKSLKLFDKFINFVLIVLKLFKDKLICCCFSVRCILEGLLSAVLECPVTTPLDLLNSPLKVRNYGQIPVRSVEFFLIF